MTTRTRLTVLAIVAGAVVLAVGAAFFLGLVGGSPSGSASEPEPADPPNGAASKVALDAYTTAVNNVWSPQPTIAGAQAAVAALLAPDPDSENDSGTGSAALPSTTVPVKATQTEITGKDGPGTQVTLCAQDNRGYAIKRVLRFTANPLAVDEGRVKGC